MGEFSVATIKFYKSVFHQSTKGLNKKAFLMEGVFEGGQSSLAGLSHERK